MKQRLEAGIRTLGLDLPATASEQLLDYLAELGKWNSAYNLTAIRDPDQMVVRHLLDSLAVLPFLNALPLVPHTSRLLDVGSGAGLPGVPLAIAAPALHVTLLDSNGKKARFLRHVQRTLGLANIEVVETRLALYHPAAPFDAVISRAFAALNDFLEAGVRVCARSGRMLAMKGRVDAEELAAARDGVQIVSVERLAVPGLDGTRHLVIAAPD